MKTKRVYTDYLSDILIAATHAQNFVVGLNSTPFRRIPRRCMP
jgi:hypothetical protein